MTGDFRLNHEDPPLLKLLWALPLVLGDRPPYPSDVAAASNNDHWKIGSALLYDSGVPPARLLTPARRVNLAVGCGVVLLAGWWAFRAWGGRLAGLAAAGFAAADPNLLALSCILSTDVGLTFFALLSESNQERVHYSTSWSWLTAGKLDFGLQILADPLSAFEMLVVAGIGGLIIWYSIGYMDGSDEERRYFAYMSLFVFSMLVLVQAGNLLLLLAGWGMVGLCSYLLIGYDQHRPAAIAAAKKAFIMNAFGDATFALALFALIQHTGTTDFFRSFFLMTQQSSNPYILFAGSFIGDYTGTAVDASGRAVTVWTDFRGNPGVTTPNQDTIVGIDF